MDDWQRLHKRIDGLAAEFDGRAFKDRLAKVGKQLEPLVENAVVNSIGDTSMSGWTHKKPAELTGRSELSTTVETGIFVAPALKGGAWRRGLGPMRVLQDGRKAYNAGDRRASGTRVKKKTGEVVTKYRKVKRKVSATKGKGTWTAAVNAMSRGIGDRVDKEALSPIIRKTWGR